MGLGEQQRALALLYTDARVRAAFFRDPLVEAARLGLGPRQAERLAELPPSLVRHFARGLGRKRLRAAVRLLPVTRQRLGDRFDALFLDFVSMRPLAGPDRYRAEARAFARHLLENGIDGHELGRHCADAVRWDSPILEAGALRRGILIRILRRPLDTHSRSSAGPNLAGLALAVWFRTSPRSRLRQVVLPLPFTLRPRSGRFASSRGY